jgi:hypothetical protein
LAAGPSWRHFTTLLERRRSQDRRTIAAVRYQHVMADRDAAIARELNRLIERG